MLLSLAAVAVAIGPLLVGLLVGALCGAAVYYVGTELLHAPHPFPPIVGLLVFVLVFLAISGVG